MTTLHLPTFFAFARRAPFGNRLTKSQVSGMETLLDVWSREGTGDDRHLAYVLATVFHETGGRMVPVRETFATSDAQAIRRLDAAKAAGRLPQVKTPYWRAGWFGRGPVQVTHETNYRKVGQALGVDLVNNPGLLLDPVVGARSAVLGMVMGLFVSRQTLAKYFNETKDDPEGARRIVNGTDKASLIAGYHLAFLDSIKAARKEAARLADVDITVRPNPVPVPATIEAAKPDGANLSKDKTAIGGVIAGLGGLGGIAAFAHPILQGIASPWAFAAFALVALGVFLVLTGRVQLKISEGV